MSENNPKQTREEERPGFEPRVHKEKWNLRDAFADRLIGTGDRAQMGRATRLARRQKGRMHALERLEFDHHEALEKGCAVAVRGAAGVEAREVGYPEGRKPGFGHLGACVEVRTKRAFREAILQFRIDDDRLGKMHPETVVAARWDRAAQRFRLIPASGFNAEHGHVFARVSRPGVYTAVALPRDPRVVTTLQLLRTMEPWSALGAKFEYHEKICQLILCSPEMKGMFEDFARTGKGLGGLDVPREALLGGDVCEQCLGGRDFGPELDLLDVFEIPPRLWKIPVPPLRLWPVPCKRWTSIGPSNIPGRMTSLAIDPTDPEVVFAGSAAGGVYRTSNGGASWTPKWHDQLSLAIGGLAVAPSNPDVIYAATGEWEGDVGAANNHFDGVGVYRSADGGQDWDRVAPIPSQSTAAVAVDPVDPNRVFVAGELSLHRSTDGGATWDITAGNADGIFDGIISDVVIDPTDSDRVYIGVHNSGVWRSEDGGATWTQLDNGIATDAAASAPKIALGRNGTHGTEFVAVKMARRVFTSPDGGETFTEQANCDVGWAPFYPWANVIAVDPEDEDVLLGGHASIYRSTDGGGTWTKVGGYGAPPVHADQQSLVFDPDDHDHIYLATDGGIYESNDNGQTWTARSNGLNTTQCWTVGVSQTPALAYGITTQDNACYEWTAGSTFNQILGPEGGFIEYDPKDADKIYADTWFASLQRSTDGGTTWTNLGIDADAGHSEGLSIAQGNTDWLLAARSTGRVVRSTDGGTNWNTTLNIAGVSITSVQFAPSDDNHAYAASDLGRVWHSGDGGATWTELPNAGLPAGRVHDIGVDWNDPRRVYLAFGMLGARQLWRGDIDAAGNMEWFDVSGALPAVSLPDLALTGLALDPTYEETIYVSNILGVYRSTDGGESWAPFDDGLPNSFVSDIDLRVRDRTLYASTMGRGVYRRRL